MIFINLPVTDLTVTSRFYEALGCERNPQFSDENAVSMVWSDTIVFMLLRKEYFATFTPKAVADARRLSEVLLSLSFESREAVDSFADAAAGAGGRADLRSPQELGFMYSRSVEDPDGHVFEAVWMDPSTMDEPADALAVSA